MYINYASTFKEAESVLEGFLENSEAVEYLKVILMCPQLAKCGIMLKVVLLFLFNSTCHILSLLLS